MNIENEVVKTQDEYLGSPHIEALPPHLPFTSKQIHLPLEMIFKIGKHLEFSDYRNFLQALWPKNDVNHIDPRRLWKLSTHQFTTTFCNGKKIRVKYNMDPWREEDEQILIDVNDLVPLFHGLLPPGVSEFTSISNLADFARVRVHLDRCSDYRYASCKCYLENDEDRVVDGMFVLPEVSDCTNGHFHHFCSGHLANWLTDFLATSVLLRETRKCPDYYRAAAFLNTLMYITQVQCADVQDLPRMDVLGWRIGG